MRPQSRSNDFFSHFWWIIALLVLTGLVVAYFLIQSGHDAGIEVIGLPVMAGLLILIWVKPEAGWMLVFQYAFLSVWLNRYTGIPLFMLDALLLFTTLSVLSGMKREQFPLLKNPLILTWVAWILIIIIGKLLLGTLHISSWATGTKGLLFYGVQWIPICLLMFQKKNLPSYFIHSLFFWGLLATIFAGIQIFFGQGIQNDAGIESNSILPSSFHTPSFFADADTFGIIVAIAALLFLLPDSDFKVSKLKFLHFAGLLVCLSGILFSGSMLACLVFLSGLYAYLLLSKKWMKFILLCGLLGLVFVFLKFTDFGNTSDLIYAIRLAVLEPDFMHRHSSAYVHIWMDYGYVGLIFFSASHIFVLVRSMNILFSNKAKEIHQNYPAILCIYITMLFAGFFYSGLYSLPLGILILLAMAVLINPRKNAETENISYSEPGKVSV